MKSSAIRSVKKTKGKYNTQVTFTDGQTAQYNLTDTQRNRLKRDHPGEYFNKFIRIKKTPW